MSYPDPDEEGEKYFTIAWLVLLTIGLVGFVWSLLA